MESEQSFAGLEKERFSDTKRLAMREPALCSVYHFWDTAGSCMTIRGVASSRRFQPSVVVTGIVMSSEDNEQ
jgi:hypothetical protein